VADAAIRGRGVHHRGADQHRGGIRRDDVTGGDYQVMTFIRVTPLNRPIKPPTDWKRECSQAERDASARYHAEQKALHAEFLREWSPSTPAPDDPEADEFYEASAIEGAAFECWQLRRQGYVAVAIAAPHWVNNVEHLWLTNFDFTGVFNRQGTAASVTLPFLMQGGEFSVTYESEKQRDEVLGGDDGIATHIRSKKRLRVQSEHGIHFGHLNVYIAEMSVDLVVLPNGTPQDVADRVAEAYGRIVALDMPNDYPVVMPLRKACVFCSKPFTDQTSKIISIGPVCASRLGISHSIARANQIVAQRKQMLGHKENGR
jgi:hypothetical protein